MNAEKYTIKVQQALMQGQSIAQGFEHGQYETTHLFKALLEQDDQVLPFILKKLGVNQENLTQVIDRQLESYAKVSGGELQASRGLSKALAEAEKAAKEFGDEYISVETLILGFLNAGDDLSRILKDNDISTKETKAAIEELRKGSKVTSHSSDATYRSLEKYARDLIQLAKDGKLDPVIGRDEEIRRVLQILNRRTKNNPILIGDPGVGKTAIAEGIAHRIVQGDVPEMLQSKKLYALDIASLVAGAKYKGEFEERLKSVVKEVVDSDGEIILFIDEIHTLVGAGGGEGAMDAANILKPALARGEMRTVGATTLDEYQKHFEKDKALTRRFQTVLIDEPSPEDAISILRGIKEKYENYHKVLIRDEAIIASVELSDRYITDRQLPDKAIDLIDEAASKLRLEMNSRPEEIDELDRKVRQLEIERQAIMREEDKTRLEEINKKLADLNEELSSMQASWEHEKGILDSVQNIKEEIESLKFEADKAEREGDFEKVAEIRYGRITEAEKKLEEATQELEKKQSSSKLIKKEISQEEIAEVVSKWTGIPVNKMLESEVQKLLHLEEELGKRVIGQERPIQAVSDAIRRARAGLQDEKKPLGSFLFLGPTGVGKTELAKALADYLFNDEHAIVRIDMSEYQEKHSVSRLVGAPPGYVGYDEGGQLTEAVRRRPYSIVLLDEIEKAHPDVYNIMLQVLDDGRLTDNKGRVVNFKNTLVLMTSNLGSDLIMDAFEKQGGSEEAFENAQDAVLELLKQQMRPEFLNRIDDTIVFHPLSKENVHAIVQLQLQELTEKAEQQDIVLFSTKEAIDWLAEEGYDPAFGARPIKRVIQRDVMNELARQILAGEVPRNEPIVMDVFEGKVVFRKPLKDEMEELVKLEAGQEN